MNCHEVISDYVRRKVTNAVQAYTGGGFDYWLVRVAPFYDAILVDPDDAGSPAPYPSQVKANPLTWNGAINLMKLDEHGNWEDPITLYDGTVKGAIEFMGRLQNVTYEDRMHVAKITGMGDTFCSY